MFNFTLSLLFILTEWNPLTLWTSRENQIIFMEVWGKKQTWVVFESTRDTMCPRPAQQMSPHITPALDSLSPNVCTKYILPAIDNGAGMGLKSGRRNWVWEEGKGRSGSLRLFLLFTIDLCGSSSAKLPSPANDPERRLSHYLSFPSLFQNLSQ